MLNVTWRSVKKPIFWKKLQNKQIHLPPEDVVLCMQKKLTDLFVGDDAFSLHEHLMKAYPVEQKRGSKKRNFNYRLCRARRVIENVLGIMSAAFKVLFNMYQFKQFFEKKCIFSKYIFATWDIRRERGEIIRGTWRNENENTNSNSF